MKFSDKEVILFDLDGTLINSAPDLALAVNHMLVTLDRDMFPEDIIDGWVGNGALMLVQRALSGKRTVDDSLDDAMVQNALDIFLKYYAKNLCNETIPYPHVKTTLNTLKKKGYRLSIVTNKPFAFVEPILEGLGMNGLFELILGGDSLPLKKPDPAPLLHVGEKLGVSVKKCVMVGDSKNDILAANACGMQSVGVTYGYNYGEDIGVHNPTVIIDDFSELLELL
ncbi:MAG: phosphoglycolate phosphatase [Sulfurovum sp.]|uniref:phosphoglycolate phosphatase n=1 Tax=Sulfurovum sp. TaxID=1969726 RepID=UPI003C70D3D3